MNPRQRHESGWKNEKSGAPAQPLATLRMKTNVFASAACDSRVPDYPQLVIFQEEVTFMLLMAL